MTPEAILQQQAVMQHLSLTNGLLLVALSVALVTSRTCTVDWTIEGAGTVTCVVSSADPGVTDSPQSDLNV